MTDYDDDDQERDEALPNVPTLYIDGERSCPLEYDEAAELERVQLEFDDAANGVQTEAQEREPLGWVNSATIHLDRSDDAVHVLISVGDPRGAFAMTVRRLPQGNSVDPKGEPVLVMHLPYPGEGMPHMPLRDLHPGTYAIG